MDITDCGHYVEKSIPEGKGTVFLKRKESLRVTCVIGESENSTDNGRYPGMEKFPFDNLVMDADSDADICFFIMPGNSVDLPLTVHMAGEGANVNISGVYLCGSDEEVNFDVNVIHRVPNCSSNQEINGVASGKSKINFYGNITVAPDARKTKAYQINHNLVLSNSSFVDARPRLEIYADDVECTHGATMGNLNEDEQFYMRSRGVPEKEAKMLQMLSFVAPVFAHIDDEDRRVGIRKAVCDAIRSIA